MEAIDKIIEWRRRRGKERAEKLSVSLKSLLDKQISAKQARFGPLSEAWDQILPQALKENSRIVDFSGGVLKVKVLSPSYAAELRMCRSELLRELKKSSPRSRLQSIRIVVG